MESERFEIPRGKHVTTYEHGVYFGGDKNVLE